MGVHSRRQSPMGCLLQRDKTELQNLQSLARRLSPGDQGRPSVSHEGVHDPGDPACSRAACRADRSTSGDGPRQLGAQSLGHRPPKQTPLLGPPDGLLLMQPIGWGGKIRIRFSLTRAPGSARCSRPRSRLGECRCLPSNHTIRNTGWSNADALS
jgi:hypothetical protein